MASRTRVMSRIISSRVILALILCSLANSSHQLIDPHKSPIFREAQDFAKPAAEQVATSTATPSAAQSCCADVKSKDGDAPRTSIGASDRIMKELKAIYKSDSYKSGALKIELVDDNIYNWDVRMPILDDECDLHKSMEKLKNEGKDDHIKFRVIFNDQYPKEPPLVRVLYPWLNPQKFAVDHGVICLELLTKSGWNPSYTMEALMLTIIDAFITASKTGRVEVYVLPAEEELTEKAGREMMDYYDRHHTRKGWKINL